MDDKKGGDNKYRSQFSMGGYDFERFHKILSEADRYGIMVWNGQDSAIKPFYSLLKQFYKNIRNIVVEKKEIDQMCIELERKIELYVTYKERGKNAGQILNYLLKDLEKFADKIYEIKQFSGLGMEITKDMSKKQRWERSAGV
jgi:DNA topoisomerase VI subunit B